jgi:hypothetical protein
MRSVYSEIELILSIGFVVIALMLWSSSSEIIMDQFFKAVSIISILNLLRVTQPKTRIEHGK